MSFSVDETVLPRWICQQVSERFRLVWKCRPLDLSTAIDKLSVISKSELTDKMKCSVFLSAVVSMLLFGCTTWTLTKRLEKKLEGNYTRMLRAILNKSWRQHPTKHQLYGHLPPITKIIQVRRTRHEGYCWRRAHVWFTPFGPPLMAEQKQGDPLEHTYSSYVKVRDVVQKDMPEAD